MGDPKEKTLTTTAADLVAAIDSTLARCFGGLDEADEARRLGLPEAAVRSLRERLEALRELAAQAAAKMPVEEMPAKAGGPDAGGPDAGGPDAGGPSGGPEPEPKA